MRHTIILRPPTQALDHDGRHILHVPIAGTQFEAKVFPEDWQALQAAGVSPNWIFNKGTVKAYVRGKPSIGTVSRQLVGASGFHQQVRYRDSNPLNLRRDNLIIRHLKTAAERDAELKPHVRARLRG